MIMDLKEALRIFDFNGIFIDQNELKKTYRTLANKYHPDRNPNGLKNMQDINCAYKFLKNIPNGTFVFNEPPKKQKKYRDPIEDYQWIVDEGLQLWIDGFMIKVSGKTFNHKERLKEDRFRWNPDDKIWWKII